MMKCVSCLGLGYLVKYNEEIRKPQCEYCNGSGISPCTFFVDELQDYGKKGKWCHLWTDGDPEMLDIFAISIGLKLEWCQLSRQSWGEFYHYDLKPSKRALALSKGAEFMKARDFVKSKINPIVDSSE